ncbi:fimbrial protein [Scandinavium goeteborgense]|uniref:fimbrial protein n=1 Tax=Scandinavium goeteborgense TaxID=1851514 RepID=UPI0037F13729
MLRQLSLLTLSVLALPSAYATCQAGAGSPPAHIFTIPAAVITVDVRAPADTSEPIATYYTDTQGSDVFFDNCSTGEMYGKSAINIGTQDPSTKIFSTNIDGIGVKVISNNGSAFSDGTLPTTGVMDYSPDTTGSWYFDGGSYYKVQFFKTKSKLTLTDPNGQEVLPAEEIAYYWLTADSPANFGQQLNIGQIKLISTPSCNYDTTQTINFGTLGSKALAATVERDMLFEMTCSTDYGTYSANASITTETPSTDSTFIKVTDAAGNSDLMGIKIRDSSGNDMKVDGSNTEKIESVESAQPAQFKWKAVLFPTGTVHPTDGAFSARAEILLQLK